MTIDPVASQRWFAVQGRVVFDEEPIHARGSITAYPILTGVAVGAVFAHIYEVIALGHAPELPGQLGELTFELLTPTWAKRPRGVSAFWPRKTCFRERGHRSAAPEPR